MQLSKQSIVRLYKYWMIIKQFKTVGYVKIFSNDLANSLGVTSTQVRKDFSLFGVNGNKRGGYTIDDLLTQLDKLLGKNERQKTIIVGVGNIGMALLKYAGFEKEDLSIEAAFDIDPMKIKEGQIPILPLDKMKDFVQERSIKIGIIAVPHFAAQQVVDLMIAAGIKGVLNFAPVNLKTPEDFVVHDINVGVELETVGYFVKAIERAKK